MYLGRDWIVLDFVVLSIGKYFLTPLWEPKYLAIYFYIIIFIIIYLLTAIGLSPVGSTHLHTNNT
jgi:hypothetical protein